MLIQMLRLLDDGGIHTVAELARRLGVGETLVASMAADLTRRGYLAALETSCATACAGCGMAARCTAAGSEAPLLPLMTLTARGREAIHGARA